MRGIGQTGVPAAEALPPAFDGGEGVAARPQAATAALTARHHFATCKTFNLHGEVTCGDCDGEGVVERDITRKSDWYPKTTFADCPVCEGNGYVLESPTEFVARAIKASPELCVMTLNAQRALAFLAESLDEHEDFDDRKETLAGLLGHVSIRGCSRPDLAVKS